MKRDDIAKMFQSTPTQNDGKSPEQVKYDNMVKRAKIVLEKAREFKEIHRGFCEGCVHFAPRKITNSYYNRCNHPIVQLHKFKNMYANNADYIDQSGEQRKETSHWTETFCKPEGFLFEPKPLSWRKVLWQKLTSFFHPIS